MKNKRYKVIILVFIILSATVYYYYQVYSSYHSLKVNNYNIKNNEIESVRFVVLTDLHDNIFKNNELNSKVKNQNPDFILIVGDMLNSDSKNSKIVISLIKELIKVAPVYYSLGNHEIEYIKKNGQDLIKEIKGTGAFFLENEYKDINIKDKHIRIGGMYSYAFGPGNKMDRKSIGKEVYDFLKDFENTSSYKIMMAHRPDSFIFGKAAKTWDINLVVSGHDHGGQVVLPFLGGLYAPDQGYLPKYVHGVYDKDNMKIIISSGLGSNKQKLLRFNNRPEVMVVNLYK